MQEVIENVLVQTALSIDYNIQFYNTTETIDTSKIINMMQKNELYRNCPISVTFHSCQQSRRLTTGNPNKEKASLPYNNHLIMYAKHSSCHD